MSSGTTELETASLTFVAGKSVLVTDVNLCLRSGEVVGLLGPNGAGKSTLVRLMAGEIEPSAGSVTLGRVPLTSLSARALARRRAVVPQATSLTFPFTVLEVILLGASVPGFSGTRSLTHDIAEESLARVNLAAFRDRFYIELSGGERQRVHIARGLCQLASARLFEPGPKVLFLDEPTSSLDLAHQRLALRAVREEAGRGTAVLAVLHDLNLASAYCDRLLMMDGGIIVADGAPAEVMREDILSKVYGCALIPNAVPEDKTPFVLPALAHSSRPAAQKDARGVPPPGPPRLG